MQRTFSIRPAVKRWSDGVLQEKKEDTDKNTATRLATIGTPFFLHWCTLTCILHCRIVQNESNSQSYWAESSLYNLLLPPTLPLLIWKTPLSQLTYKAHLHRPGATWGLV